MVEDHRKVKQRSEYKWFKKFSRQESDKNNNHKNISIIISRSILSIFVNLDATPNSPNAPRPPRPHQCQYIVRAQAAGVWLNPFLRPFLRLRASCKYLYFLLFYGGLIFKNNRLYPESLSPST